MDTNEGPNCSCNDGTTNSKSATVKVWNTTSSTLKKKSESDPCCNLVDLDSNTYW